MYKFLSKNLTFPEAEEEILKFWEENKIFEKTLESRRKKPPFVFFEGPPTANGRPGIHHILARAYKDIFCRFKTMRGYLVKRRAGWDTHGLPVELEVEKQLGIKNKEEIEKYGIDKFNQKCRESVWTYKDEWERLTKRMGFWLDMKNPYVTYETNYIESLWWIIAKIFSMGLLERDYKVVPYCPRCGTTLSSHELALGYKTTKDPSIYVRFKIKNKKNEYFLVWTTTPWTLPANVAIAVNPKIDYYEFETGGDKYISYRLPKNIEKDGKVLRKIKGKDLLGIEYEPLYNFLKLDKKAHFVIAGDFVSTEDGTGLVHIAPAFGEDDMNAGKKNNLPVLMTLDEKGRFLNEVSPWKGMFVKNADPLIIEDLEKKGLLVFADPLGIEHEYPFCWRCSTPLLYFAKKSWFVRMSKLKKELNANNKKVNWVPSHIKEGRFGEWLKDVKDWAFSRERYWGTPLPLWECGKCGEIKAVSSLLDFKEAKPKNNYFVLRHGHYGKDGAENGNGNVNCWPEKGVLSLTKSGIEEVKKSVKVFKKTKKKIDYIFSSDLRRTKETAEIASQILNVKNIIYDERLREINIGTLNGMPISVYHSFFKNNEERFSKKAPEGENLTEVKKRVVDFIFDIEEKYKGKNILIVSHGDPLWLMISGLTGLDMKETIKMKDKIKTGELKEINFYILPLDNEANVNLHRPYVDYVKFNCKKCGLEMNRVKEVCDVWFDSGAMPYAQDHFPFSFAKKEKILNKNVRSLFKKLDFPADFIAEGIDQTRGWFYTLLAVSALLKKGSAYKNVIALGHVLDKNGQKMSKSKGNMVDPWEMIKKYGIDGTRWYFYSVNSAGEPKKFDEKDISEKTRIGLGMFFNSYVFLNTYIDKKYFSGKNFKLDKKPVNVLDKWVLKLLDKLITNVIKDLENFDATSAIRKIEEFLKDFSNWYVRRSRARLQRPEDINDYRKAVLTMAFVLLELSKIIAPFAPFIAERVYLGIKNLNLFKNLPQSVHLCDFPKMQKNKKDDALIILMKKARDFSYEAHKLRSMTQIKVRQPLAKFYVIYKKSFFTFPKDILGLIAEEINVHDVEVINGKKTEADFYEKLRNDFDFKFSENEEFVFALNTHINRDLEEEGIMREFVRNLQEMRKTVGFMPKDVIEIRCFGSEEMVSVIKKFEKKILSQVSAKNLLVKEDKEKVFDLEKNFEISGKKIWIGIKSA